MNNYGIDISKFDVLPSEYLAREERRLKMYNYQKSLLQVDMIDVKDSILGTIYFKRITPTPPQPDEIFEFEFDYWNLDLIRSLSQVSSTKFEYIGKLLEEFDVAYDEVYEQISSSDAEIFDSYRKGVSEEIISNLANRFETDSRNIYKRIKRVLELVQRKMIENYEINYYYTEKVKADWKKCSKCDESYPRNEYYWNKHKTGRDGFQAFCKKCDVKRARK